MKKGAGVQQPHYPGNPYLHFYQSLWGRPRRGPMYICPDKEGFHRAVDTALAQLAEPYRTALIARHGLADAAPQSYQAIAQALGVTPTRVGNILQTAESRLRRSIPWGLVTIEPITDPSLPLAP